MHGKHIQAKPWSNVCDFFCVNTRNVCHLREIERIHTPKRDTPAYTWVMCHLDEGAVYYALSRGPAGVSLLGLTQKFLLMYYRQWGATSEGCMSVYNHPSCGFQSL